ncbi:hypothetical protein PtrSN002B_006423 [Pyrenophora tritici-repentis]|uniref:Uncharacterized protein n=2 Tax=Pyrenophora tritici-repentis TaxID=45151 RepID=A0A2W1CSQ8_9PLEO|nr:uncharacterized protein PTRG_04978 [Pyrenophora tritici-repentis Pt-1C-BFP]KAA8611891.1 hypothetical protein PtrV1_13767 [Pyrenophora tritici-repentis]EDU47885.1 predicted protein [Pyrenophora tritici-repentis Pt-1C-BFP]KAF7447209.1 hypothetical protein A1F99_086560 [Pyrenophora tritici-repentis]KAF7569557.1 hypothetical protein PtrM4_119720 [Pyrenophora tritici-repentis]KAG9382693.1 hypothetical protein A1F94_006614 [Pyrenophora tritici-repentis]
MSSTVPSNDMADECSASTKAGDKPTSLSEDAINTETSDKSKSVSDTVAETETSDNPEPPSEDRSKSPSEAGGDAEIGEINEESMAKLSLGSDNESACHPDLDTPPDLATVTESLIGLPKQIIKRYYGNRIRFFTDYAGIRHSLAWAVKIDDVIQPFAILFLTPPDGRLEIEMKDEDDIPVDGLPANVIRTEKLQDLALEVQNEHGCKRVGFYDGKRFIWATCNPQPGIGKGPMTPDGRPLMYSHGPDIFRSQLLLCLAEAMDGMGVKMLEPLKGYTLENSRLAGLGLGVPRKKPDGHFDFDGAKLMSGHINIGECVFRAYARENGDIMEIDDLPLPEIEDDILTTSLGVRIAAREPLLDLLGAVAKSWMGYELKHSYDIIPDALTWYVRDQNRSKLYVAILQLAPAGTIVEQDWGMIRADLTYDNNNEGIVRTAAPLRDEMLILGQQYNCSHMALFDYRGFVTVSRSSNAAFISSVTFAKEPQIASRAVQWLVTAFADLE